MAEAAQAAASPRSAEAAGVGSGISSTDRWRVTAIL
jgi:hypothetical protein